MTSTNRICSELAVSCATCAAAVVMLEMTLSIFVRSRRVLVVVVDAAAAASVCYKSRVRLWQVDEIA